MIVVIFFAKIVTVGVIAFVSFTSDSKVIAKALEKKLAERYKTTGMKTILKLSIPNYRLTEKPAMPFHDMN